MTAVPTSPPRIAPRGLGRMLRWRGVIPPPLLPIRCGAPQLDRGRELLALALLVHRPDDGARLHLEVMNHVVGHRYLGSVSEDDPAAPHCRYLAFHHLHHLAARRNLSLLRL